MQPTNRRKREDDAHRPERAGSPTLEQAACWPRQDRELLLGRSIVCMCTRCVHMCYDADRSLTPVHCGSYATTEHLSSGPSHAWVPMGEDRLYASVATSSRAHACARRLTPPKRNTPWEALRGARQSSPAPWEKPLLYKELVVWSGK